MYYFINFLRPVLPDKGNIYYYELLMILQLKITIKLTQAIMLIRIYLENLTLGNVR